eukprot:ANDGO_01470.mRNA.1 Squalene synthase
MSTALALLSHPDELWAALRLRFMPPDAPSFSKSTNPDLAFCYRILRNVSRSFSAVIEALPDGLRDSICIFYLVLRALDTIEDDTAIDRSVRIRDCMAFHTHLGEVGFSYAGCGSGDYELLLREYQHVNNVYLRLPATHQVIVKDITEKMGKGMAKFLDPATEGVKTWDDWNEYCHYVAGLVGEGLSRLFAVSGFEDPSFSNLAELSNAMGLFLQKTNIIRDYLEDLDEERMFWPSDVWGKYAKNIEDFASRNPAQRSNALKCLNELITNALEHAPQSLDYISRLRHPQVFAFCAIPQVMAIGTLAACYNNGKLFEGVVKIRKGQAAKMMLYARNMPAVYSIFYGFAADIAEKVPVTDPSAAKTHAICRRIKDMCVASGSVVPRRVSRGSSLFGKRIILAAMAVISFWVLWTNRKRISSKLRLLTSPGSSGAKIIRTVQQTSKTGVRVMQSQRK